MIFSFIVHQMRVVNGIDCSENGNISFRNGTLRRIRFPNMLEAATWRRIYGGINRQNRFIHFIVSRFEADDTPHLLKFNGNIRHPKKQKWKSGIKQKKICHIVYDTVWSSPTSHHIRFHWNRFVTHAAVRSRNCCVNWQSMKCVQTAHQSVWSDISWFSTESH